MDIPMVLRNTIKERDRQIADLKDKLQAITSLSLEKTRIVEELEDKLHRRNMQIKDLKAKIKDNKYISEWNKGQILENA